VLNGAFLAVDYSSDDKRQPRIASQVQGLAGRINRVEDDLESVGDGDTNDGGLRRLGRRYRGLDRQSMLAQKREKLCGVLAHARRCWSAYAHRWREAGRAAWKNWTALSRKKKSHNAAQRTQSGTSPAKE